jgi:hypothetical protein
MLWLNILVIASSRGLIALALNNLCDFDKHVLITLKLILAGSTCWKAERVNHGTACGCCYYNHLSALIPQLAFVSIINSTLI